MRYNWSAVFCIALMCAACGDSDGETQGGGLSETTVGASTSAETSGGTTSGETSVNTTGSSGRPSLSMGPDDALSQAACALLQGDQDPRIAVEAASDAGQVLVTPTESQAYLVTLPESGVGYITLEVPDWSIVIGASTDYTQSVSILDPDFVTEETLPLSWNGTCPEEDLTDQRTKFHAWGSFTVEISGDPGDEVLLSFIKEEE